MKQHPGFLRAFQDCEDIVASAGIAVLVGDRGTGKTQCGVELIRDAIARGQTARYARAREIGLFIRQTFDVRGASEADAIKKFTLPRLLVIDEFQERGGTEWDDKLMTMIVDVRYSNRRPTVIAGNMTEQGFRQIAGPSIIDRIHEVGLVIPFTWPSFRRQR